MSMRDFPPDNEVAMHELYRVVSFIDEAATYGDIREISAEARKLNRIVKKLIEAERKKTWHQS